MDAAIPVSTIAHLIQLSIGPVFLVAGGGAILNVLATRLARVVDRVRWLEEEFPGATPVRQQLARSELKRLGTRMKLVNWSITACTAALLCTCLVVAIMFIGGLGEISFGRLIAALFVLTMALLVTALLLFLLEVRMASRTLRVRYELLEDDMEKEPG
jgi:hypothetical protein